MHDFSIQIKKKTGEYKLNGVEPNIKIISTHCTFIYWGEVLNLDENQVRYFIGNREFENFFFHLKGSYFGCVMVNNIFNVCFSDYFGTFKVFTYENDDVFTLTNSIFLIDVKPKLELHNLLYFLNWGYNFGGHTYFQSIKSIPAGNILKLKHKRIFQEQCYNLLDTQPLIRSSKKVLFQNLKDGVSLPNKEQKKIVLLLSGGADSKLLLKLVTGLKLKDVEAINGYWPPNIDSESYIDSIKAKKLAERFNIPIRSLKFRLPENIGEITKAIKCDPLNAPEGALPYFLFLEEVKSIYGSNVCLINGENADTILQLGLTSRFQIKHPGTILMLVKRYFYSKYYLTKLSKRKPSLTHSFLLFLSNKKSNFKKILMGSIPSCIIHTSEEYQLGYLKYEGYLPFQEKVSILKLEGKYEKNFDEYLLKHYLNPILQSVDKKKDNNLKLHNVNYLLKLNSHMQGGNVQGPFLYAKNLNMNMIFPFRDIKIFSHYYNKKWGLYRIILGKNEVYQLTKNERIETIKEKLAYVAENPYFLHINNYSFRKLAIELKEDILLIIEILPDQIKNKIYDLFITYIETKQVKDNFQVIMRLVWVAYTVSVKNK